jgi:hypothetical protein
MPSSGLLTDKINIGRLRNLAERGDEMAELMVAMYDAIKFGEVGGGSIKKNCTFSPNGAPAPQSIRVGDVVYFKPGSDDENGVAHVAVATNQGGARFSQGDMTWGVSLTAAGIGGAIEVALSGEVNVLYNPGDRPDLGEAAYLRTNGVVGRYDEPAGTGNHLIGYVMSHLDNDPDFVRIMLQPLTRETITLIRKMIVGSDGEPVTFGTSTEGQVLVRRAGAYEGEALPAGTAPGAQALSSAGQISPTLGFTELNYTSGTSNLANGSTDGLEKIVMINHLVAHNTQLQVTCNIWRGFSADYTTINPGFALTGPLAWVRLKWSSGITTAGGPKNLWVIVGSSPITNAGDISRVQIASGTPAS